MTSTSILDVPLYTFPDYEKEFTWTPGSSKVVAKDGSTLVLTYINSFNVRKKEVTLTDGQKIYSRVVKKGASKYHVTETHFRNGIYLKVSVSSYGKTQETFCTPTGNTLAIRWLINGKISDPEPGTPAIVLWNPETQTKDREEFWTKGKIRCAKFFTGNVITRVLDFPNNDTSIIPSQVARSIGKTSDISLLISKFNQLVIEACIKNETRVVMECENEAFDTFLLREDYSIERCEKTLKIRW